MENSGNPGGDTQEAWYMIPHTVPKIQDKYSQRWNCAASFPISTFLYLWAIYILPRSVRLFCCIVFSDFIGNEAAQFHFEEYLIKFSGQCICNAASSREKIFGHVSWRRRTTPATQPYSLLVMENSGNPVRYPRSLVYDTPHCTENTKHIFPEMKMCSLVPNIYIPVSVSDWYILTIGLPILPYCICKPSAGI